MGAKKIVLIILLSGLCIAFFIWVAAYDPYKTEFYYLISDNEYFGIESLKELPVKNDDYDRVSKDIKYVSGMIIRSSFENNGKLPEQLTGYVSEDVFERLDEGKNADYGSVHELLNDKAAYEYFDFCIYDIKHDYNKAIVDFGIDHVVCYYGSNKRICGSWAEEVYPYKLYLSLKDGTWVVDDVFIPA